MNRRQFLTGLTALALVPRIAIAEPCTRINLDFLVEITENQDLFTNTVLYSTPEIASFAKNLVTDSANELLKKDLGLELIRVGGTSITSHISTNSNQIILVYGTQRSFLVEEIDRVSTEDLVHFLSRYYNNSEQLESSILKYKRTRTPEDFFDFYNLVKNRFESSVLGITDKDSKRINLFQRPEYQAELFSQGYDANAILIAYCKFISFNLIHEIGHVLGFNHSSNIHLLDGRKDIMFPQNSLSLNETIFQNYGFNELDRSNFRARYCN